MAKREEPATKRSFLALPGRHILSMVLALRRALVALQD
jgi:hypothetical protein